MKVYLIMNPPLNETDGKYKNKHNNKNSHTPDWGFGSKSQKKRRNKKRN